MNHTISLELHPKNGVYRHPNSFLVESNLPANQVQEAYELGSKQIGFDLIKEVAVWDDYPCFTIKEEYARKLHEAGFDMNLDDGSSLDYITWFEEAHVDAFIFIAKMGNPDLKIDYLVDTNQVANLDLGGNGFCE